MDYIYSLSNFIGDFIERCNIIEQFYMKFYKACALQSFLSKRIKTAISSSPFLTSHYCAGAKL